MPPAPRNGKANITRSCNGLAPTIPSRKPWFAMTFGPVWLNGWAVAPGGGWSLFLTVHRFH